MRRPKWNGIIPQKPPQNGRFRLVTLPLKNVSLAEWFNSDKENVNDEDIKGALHARIQARGGKAGRGVGRASQRLPGHRGVVDQTLFNGVKAQRQGKLKGADSKPVSAEQIAESAGCGPSWPA